MIKTVFFIIYLRQKDSTNMDKNKIKNSIKYIKFFQNENYVERVSQINPYHGYDNYLDYYLCEHVNLLKFLKIKAKSKLANVHNSLNDTKELLTHIDTKNYVCVVSPFYKDKKLDGYYKRVQEIDENVLNGFKKIYLDHTDLGNRSFSINAYDDNHIVIKYNSFNNQHLECIKKIVNAINKIYIHSIHSLMPDVMNYQMIDVIFDENNKTILDLHGVVTEELKLFDTDERAKLSELVEEISIGLSDRIVCMSEAMKDYYIEKYALDPNRLIIASILPSKDIDTLTKSFINNSIPTVVYAGGIQKWQNIDLIKESIELNHGKYYFKIFTHDSEKLKDEWKDLADDNLIIDSKNNEEIYKEYDSCDFGYLLRDDNIINNVACPTKLMEYIMSGIVPILKSNNIGSFIKYGLKYVDINDFNKGIIPDTEERKEIAESNFKIYLKILNQSKTGYQSIIDYLQ